MQERKEPGFWGKNERILEVLMFESFCEMEVDPRARDKENLEDNWTSLLR